MCSGDPENLTTKVHTQSRTSKRMIDKKFLPVKIALFCWFAGAFSSVAFLPVFLKHQGLSIAHFSLFNGISVGVQTLGGIVTGFLADKLGCIKPFWFFFYGMFCVGILSIASLPHVSLCGIENTPFECYNEDMFLFNVTSCRLMKSYPPSIVCSHITMYNENKPAPLNGTYGLVVTLFPEFDKNLHIKYLKNISGVYSVSKSCANCPVINSSACALNRCEPSRVDCSTDNAVCNPNAKFWVLIYGIFVVLIDFSRTNVFRFNDIIVSDLTFESKSDFGRQRMYGILGNLVGPPLVGIILNAINGSNEGEKSYTALFVCIIAFTAMSAISMSLVKPKFHKPTSKMWKKSFNLFNNLDVILFFVLGVTMGCVIGFQFTYRNWYLKELGASDLLTGIVSGATSFYGIIFLYNSKWFINEIGVRNIFVLGLLGHVVYSFSFSALGPPWIALILESTTILSYHLFWVAVIQYSDEMAPEGLVAVMKALIGSLHFNVGKLGSSLVAGYVMNIYGGRVAFTVLGCTTSVYLLVYGSYLIIQHVKQRKIIKPSESATEHEIPG